MEFTWIIVACLIWLTLATVNAGIAESKNRSRTMWFGTSLLTGPIATIILILTPREEKKFDLPALAENITNR